MIRGKSEFSVATVATTTMAMLQQQQPHWRNLILIERKIISIKTRSKKISVTPVLLRFLPEYWIASLESCFWSTSIVIILLHVRVCLDIIWFCSCVFFCFSHFLVSFWFVIRFSSLIRELSAVWFASSTFERFCICIEFV